MGRGKKTTCQTPLVAPMALPSLSASSMTISDTRSLQTSPQTYHKQDIHILLSEVKVMHASQTCFNHWWPAPPDTETGAALLQLSWCTLRSPRQDITRGKGVLNQQIHLSGTWILLLFLTFIFSQHWFQLSFNSHFNHCERQKHEKNVIDTVQWLCLYTPWAINTGGRGGFIWQANWGFFLRFQTVCLHFTQWANWELIQNLITG